MGIIKSIKEIFSEKDCKHDNIRWSNQICLIEGYRKEGICMDCGARMFKDMNGEVTNK